jgi:hypothetical protein
VVAFGVYVAFTQLRNNRVNQRETTAKGIFREYLKLAFENPQFAEPNYQELKKDSETFSRYSWFVAYLLWSSEEIMRFATKKDLWEKNIQLNVNYHREYFINDDNFKKNDLPTYEPSVRKLVQTAISKTT